MRIAMLDRKVNSDKKKGNKLSKELLQQHLQKNTKFFDDYLTEFDYLTGKKIKPSDQILVCEKKKMAYIVKSRIY